MYDFAASTWHFNPLKITPWFNNPMTIALNNYKMNMLLRKKVLYVAN
jgi:hypothetical protein